MSSHSEEIWESFRRSVAAGPNLEPPNRASLEARLGAAEGREMETVAESASSHAERVDRGI